jgi:hypothetical protein
MLGARDMYIQIFTSVRRAVIIRVCKGKRSIAGLRIPIGSGVDIHGEVQRMKEHFRVKDTQCYFIHEWLSDEEYARVET